MTAKNSKLRIVTLPGDGIGCEVVPAARHRAETPIAGAADSAEQFRQRTS